MLTVGVATGTLVQNRYMEVWSVLDFVRNTYLSSPPIHDVLMCPHYFQVAQGQIGDQRHWKELICDPIDEGMKHNATAEELVNGRVRRFPFSVELLWPLLMNEHD